ncbi:endonuclease [Streptomyces sp. WAC 06738]|uniref:endonuclease n=1 Tax=Streptomyces sp. WAC 06738 TaxID=2203210 RepID=UPI000F6F3F38|nr:endonuclease [Streptomyces sp. WAC 06738]AZM49877.1 endonuclease [Streptomyces sp. WAC 06738]
MTQNQQRTVHALLDGYGTTYAEDAGIRLRNTPQPLYQLLVLSGLLSARIRAGAAVGTARALFQAGLGSPQRMADATWRRRVQILGEGGYRRYDESTASQLGDGARLLLDTYGGDLRRLRREADGDTTRMSALLRRFPGLGPAGAAIFLREVQGVWPEAAPYIDAKVVQGAGKVGLPEDPSRLARLVGEPQLPRFTAALVHCALDKGAAQQVRELTHA